jgi:hypothetical protein
LVTDCHSILAGWRKYFCQLFNVQGFSGVRHTEIHTAEPLVPAPSAYGNETAIEKLKRHKSPGIDRISANMIKAGGRTIRYEIHKLIIAIWTKGELPEEWEESIIVPIYTKGVKHIGVIIEAYHFCQLRTEFYPPPCCQG